jgi:hypothetical protein
MKIMILISAMFLAIGVWAAEDVKQTHALMTPQEQEIYQKAKKRLYPGGKDEESLQVQSQLPVITRKMGPSQEAPSEEPEEHQEAND